MTNIYDRWHKSHPAPGEEKCGKHRLVPSEAHGVGLRWQVRWKDGDQLRRASFEYIAQAELYAKNLEGAWCLVPKCNKSAVTEPPVLLCADHRELLLQQIGRKKPTVHEPVVYFVRNGSRVKIGWTTNLKGRLSSLSLPASAVATLILGGPEEESFLHGKFARTRLARTEWFDSCEEIDAYIAEHPPAAGTYVGKLFAQVCGGQIAA